MRRTVPGSPTEIASDQSLRRAPLGSASVLDGCVALAVALVFGTSIGFGLTNWDDFEAITGNPLVREPLSQGLARALTTPHLGYPQPTTLLSHHIDWLVGNGKAWPFHVTNLVLHAANAICVRHLASAYGIAPRWSLVAALCFALHPVVTEPVCWATGRKDLLAALSTLACVLLYRASPLGLGRATALLGCFLLGLGSKPTAVVTVALLALEHVVNRQRPPRAQALLLALFAACAAADVALALSLQGQVGALAPARPPLDAAAYVLQHWALQTRQVIAPFWLSPLYFEHLPRPWTSAWGVAGAGTALATGWIVAKAWKRGAPLRFLILWPLVAFMPSSGVIGLTRGPADTYAYLPLAGVALALSALGQQLGGLRLARSPVIVGWLAGLALLSMRQSQIWRTSSSLWRAVVAQYPDEPSAHQNLGDALLLEGRPGPALPHLERALSLWPLDHADPGGLRALADACFFRERYACATRWYAEVWLRFGPSRAVAFRLLSAHRLAPLEQYRPQQEEALKTAQDALRAIQAGRATPASVFEASLRGDRIPVIALRGLASDPDYENGALRLLEIYAEREIRPTED